MIKVVMILLLLATPAYAVMDSDLNGALDVAGGGTNVTTVAAEVSVLAGENWVFLGSIDMTGASSVNLGPITFADIDGSPTAVGMFRYDNTVTGLTDGALEWHDGTSVHYVVDLKTLPVTDGEVISYDAANDKFVMATPGSGDNISIDSVAVVDPDFVSTGDIDFVDTSNTVTANINTGAVGSDELASTAVTPAQYTLATVTVDADGRITAASSGTSLTRIPGTAVLGTSAIASGACATVVTATATGTLTTDVVNWGFNGDPTAVTGYSASTDGMLTIISYPTANTVNFKVCNNLAASVTPGAITLNWEVIH